MTTMRAKLKRSFNVAIFAHKLAKARQIGKNSMNYNIPHYKLGDKVSVSGNILVYP